MKFTGEKPPRHPPFVGCHPSGGGEYFSLFCTGEKNSLWLND